MNSEKKPAPGQWRLLSWKEFLALLCLLACVAFAMSVFSSCTVTVPVAASGPIGGAKEGRSASVRVLGLTVQDRGDVRTAARAGGIQYVQTVDVATTRIFGIYRKSVTIVTGE